jgi:hypothetical protein
MRFTLLRFLALMNLQDFMLLSALMRFLSELTCFLRVEKGLIIFLRLLPNYRIRFPYEIICFLMHNFLTRFPNQISCFLTAYFPHAMSCFLAVRQCPFELVCFFPAQLS